MRKLRGIDAFLTWGLRSNDTSSLTATARVTRPVLATSGLSGFTKVTANAEFAGSGRRSCLIRRSTSSTNTSDTASRSTRVIHLHSSEAGQVRVPVAVRSRRVSVSGGCVCCECCHCGVIVFTCINEKKGKSELLSKNRNMVKTNHTRDEARRSEAKEGVSLSAKGL
jgi:hypothetical protein